MEDHRHVKALNKLVQERLPSTVSMTDNRIGEGAQEVVLHWEMPEDVTTKVTLDLSNNVFQVNSTSGHMRVYEPNLTDRLITYISLVQEVLPFGCLEFNWNSREANFRTTQSLLGISKADDLFSFHVFVHLRMFPKVSKSFRQAQKQATVSQASLEELAGNLGQELEDAHDLEQLLP